MKEVKGVKVRDRTLLATITDKKIWNYQWNSRIMVTHDEQNTWNLTLKQVVVLYLLISKLVYC